MDDVVIADVLPASGNPGDILTFNEQTTEWTIAAAPRPDHFSICSPTDAEGNQKTIKIYFDGRVEFEGMRPSEAAKLFWQAVRFYFPGNEEWRI